MKPEPRTLTVCPSCRGLPRIVLCGQWVHEWGFKIGQSLLAHYAGKGTLVLKIQDADDGGSFPASSLPQTPQPVSPSDAIKLRLHPTQVSTSDGRSPKITIIGAWLEQWDIKLADKVSVTKTAGGHIQIQVTMPAAQLLELKSQKILEQTAALEAHKTQGPRLFEEDTRQNTLPVKSRKKVQQIASAFPDYLVTLIAPSARLPVVH